MRDGNRIKRMQDITNTQDEGTTCTFYLVGVFTGPAHTIYYLVTLLRDHLWTHLLTDYNTCACGYQTHIQCGYV